MEYTSTRKWSDIRDQAVVNLANGSKVGRVEDFYFDPRTNTIPALLIKTGMFGHRVLMVNTISAFGLDAITMPDEKGLIEAKDDPQLSTMPLGRYLLTYRVLSEGGTLVGNIREVLLDVTTPGVLRVAAFEMEGGLRARISHHYPTFEANRVVRYGQDVLIIPDEVALQLTH